MANATTEPRALQAALAAPVFHTRGSQLASRVADRHVERWAPETSAQRMRSMRSLGFVDRLVSPWMEAAQRSASMRLFSGYARNGLSERQGGDVSWVFPRPWYQDELDWMAAARRQSEEASYEPSSSSALFTTRGTYVAPTSTERAVVPPSLYEFVAPSLSVASPSMARGLAPDGSRAQDAYSPLVPLAAVHAAQLMSRTVAPLTATAMERPALRTMLASMLQRAAVNADVPTRSSQFAPELVTPPAPRPELPVSAEAGSELTPSSISSSSSSSSTIISPAMMSPAMTLAEQYATQRQQIVELQRIAEQSVRRDLAARVEAARAPELAVIRRAETSASASASAPAPERRIEADAQQQRLEVQQRAEAEAQQRAVEVTQAAERVRIEDRVAQRIAERRLHEQSRTTAAEHARSFEAPAPAVRETAAAIPRVPAEISAAIAALPPELATYLGHRPERAMQAIAELNDVLRTAELLARTSASGGSLEVTRGPRLMMPAGLGGLIATVDRAPTISSFAAPSAGVPQALATPAFLAAVPARRDVRVPAMSFVAPGAAAPSALGAASSMAPAALSHVAWSDRWLARFTGASPRSLDVLKATSASPELRMQALAAAAPETVFVAPMFAPTMVRGAGEVDRDVAPSAGVGSFAGSTSASTTPAPIQRFADDEETPDSVFEQIAASAATARAPASSPQPSSLAASPTFAAPTGRVERASFAADEPERFTLADAVVRGAPSAPGAGLSAQLASSPFAPALKHLLPLPASTSFDVRALFGGGISATYLAGLLAAESHEVDVPGSAPAWSRWATADQAFTPMIGERAAPDFDATYVAPELARAGLADELTGDAATDEIVREVQVVQAVQAAQAELAALTTVRTALLSWTAENMSELSAPAITTSQSAPVTQSTARAMIESMALPMLGEASHDEVPGSWALPGMIADRAHGWSVAQERSASDLALDFVTPELVLAARVYGLGPAEAAQAARLALAGPGQLTAMAGAVDRTFVQALAIDADRREGRAPSTTAQGVFGTPGVPGSMTASYEPGSAPSAAPFEPARAPSSFGVERRAPRGAFLWPSATVGALGLTAAAPDGQQSMTVAALELLAAQAVAEIGTYAALGESPVGSRIMQQGGGPSSDAFSAARSSEGSEGSDGIGRTADADHGENAGEAEVLSAVSTLVPEARRARFDALYVALSQAPNARTWSPAARAARALALAGRGEETPPTAYERAAAAWDVLPVVYASDGVSITDTIDQVTPELAVARSAAARAPGNLVQVDGRPGLSALSGRAGEALGSFVSPMGAAPSARSASSTSSSSTTASSSSSSSTSSSTSSDREVGALLRPPSAAQELVRTGRPAGRHGGGEVEIPSWFEAAARKMLEDRSGNADGISLAELTLVTAAPTAHIAASTRTAPSAGPPAPSADAGKAPSDGEPIDVEKIANEVYRQILVMMDAARARNGEPYL